MDSLSVLVHWLAADIMAWRHQLAELEPVATE